MKRMKFLVGAIVLGLLLAVSVGVSMTAQAQSQAQAWINAPAPQGNAPGNTIDDAGFSTLVVENAGMVNYQGRLLQGGLPYSGNIDLTFRLYRDEIGGLSWYTETQTVSVNNGLFSVMLGAVEPLDGYAERFGYQNWLGIQPAGAAAELTPRQMLSTAASAFTLIPGASIYDYNSGGPEDHYWHSFWVSSSNHPAAYFSSGSSYAISANVYSDTEAIASYSSLGSGVYATAGEADGSLTIAGVVGNTDSAAGAAIIGRKVGGMGLGVYGSNEGTTGSGVSGNSANYIGLWGYTGSADNNYGLYTPDNIYSLNYHLLGAIMQVMQNSGSQPLQAGDVVAFSGIADPLTEGGSPVVQVTRIDQANSTAVAGVVYSGYNLEAMLTADPNGQGLADPNATILLDGPVPQGGYLLVVIQGPALVNAEAITGAIQPGDLLSSSSTAGYAARATEVNLNGISIAAPGTIFAKALEALEEGQALLYVFVTLQ